MGPPKPSDQTSMNHYLTGLIKRKCWCKHWRMTMSGCESGPAGWCLPMEPQRRSLRLETHALLLASAAPRCVQKWGIATHGQVWKWGVLQNCRFNGNTMINYSFFLGTLFSDKPKYRFDEYAERWKLVHAQHSVEISRRWKFAVDGQWVDYMPWGPQSLDPDLYPIVRKTISV